MEKYIRSLLYFILLNSFNLNLLIAGTTGKLTGRVLDKHNELLPSVNVQIIGTKLGTVTDFEGYYTIINIPSGNYNVQYSLVGYRTFIIKDVKITADHTTKQDAILEESLIEQQEVIVSAERPIVDVNYTSSVVSLTDRDIQTLPVQELRDIVNLQAGVVDGHFRGGRLGEVQYQVNGVTINNPFDNSSTLRLDRSLLQEVQVISGTFDAEYGQAMSGVVNAILKSGTEDLRWNAELSAGDYFFPDNKRRIVNYKANPASLQSYQISISGPTLLPKTFFIVNARRSVSNDYFLSERRFIPTDRSDFEQKKYLPTGDGKKFPIGFNSEWSGLAKLSNRSLHGIEISYQMILNEVNSKRPNFAYRFNPDGLPTQKTFSVLHGLDIIHSLSASSFYNFSIRQNYFNYKDFVYESIFDSAYINAGPPMGDPNYELGGIIQGVDLNRFKQLTNSLVFKGALTSQVTREHQLKCGIEYQLSNVQFGSPGYLVPTMVGGVQVLRPRIDEPPDYPGIQTYHPISLAAYAQDQMEWHDLTLRAGVRFEFFDARATVPSDLQNPANSISGAPLSSPKKTITKRSFSPRLGVSYPVTTRAAVYFAYGYFYQLPGLGQIFSNSDYSILKDLQAGGISYGVLGNPDIKPERTVQYEFGYKHEVTEFLGVDVSIFYKDIRDLLGVEFISTYAAAEYARLTNIDFGNVLGFTLALDQRRIGILNTSLDYTWQMAQGNSSDPRETAIRASTGEDPRPRQVPLNWDQRHTLTLLATLQKPNDFSITTVSRLGSGQPYTPSIGSGFGANLETNSDIKPTSFVVDLRSEKFFKLFGINISTFLRIYNLFDTRFNNGFVFSDTGSPDYSLNSIGDRATLLNPLRFYPPRKIEIGLVLNAL